MEKPDFITGREDRFMNFVSGIVEGDKVAIVSHGADLDGFASAKIINAYVKAENVFLVDYSDANVEFVEKLRNLGINKLIFSDINLPNTGVVKLFEDFSEVLIIDHHRFAEDFNSEKTIFMNAQGYCAAYLCYYLFSKIEAKEELAWMAACASVSDWMFFKNGSWLGEIYKKYGDNFDSNDIKSGKFWDFQKNLSSAIVYFNEDRSGLYENFPKEFGVLGDLESGIKEVDVEIEEAVKKFDKEKVKINERWFWEGEFKFAVTSIVINIISHGIPSETVILGAKDGEFYKVSGRRQDRREDMSVLIKNLVSGLE